jgi:hypothetical protein
VVTIETSEMKGAGVHEENYTFSAGLLPARRPGRRSSPTMRRSAEREGCNLSPSSSPCLSPYSPGAFLEVGLLPTDSSPPTTLVRERLIPSTFE